MNMVPEIGESERLEVEGISQLSDYLAICRRRLWLIVVLTFASVSIAALWSLTQTPSYESISGVVFEPPVPQVVKTEMDQAYKMTFDREQFQTHVELLTSYPVLAETIQKLNLSEHPEFFPKPSILSKMWSALRPAWLDSVKSLLRDIKAWVKEWLDGSESIGATETVDRLVDEFPDPEERSLVGMFGSQVSVEQVEGSKLVNVIVESVNPFFSARAANTLASVYIDRFHHAQSESTQSSAQWYANHLNELRQKVEESEKAIYSYRSEHELVDTSKQESIADQKLAEINSDLVAAESRRLESQTKFEQVRRIWKKVRSASKGQSRLNAEDISDLTNILDSPTIRNFRAKQIELSVMLAQLSEKYGPLHPEMIRAQSELKAVEIGIVEEIEKTYRSVRHGYHLAQEQERASRNRLANQKTEKIALDKYVAELSILEREANSNRVLFDAFLEQMKKTDLATDIKASNMHLATSALPNMNPVGPNTGRNVLMGLLVGLGSGVGLAFFLEFYDRRLKGPKDLENYSMGYPVIGWVPKLPKNFDHHGIPLIESDPLSMAADCYRRIRTSVWLSASHEESLSLAVTSPGEQEGKTSLTVNLAIAMSQLEGSQVVIVDADLRRPSVQKFFEMGNGQLKGKGLAEFLAGKAEVHEILHQTRIPNVLVIPSGKMVRNHTELLHSKQLSTLLGWFQQRQYHVIFDTPPVLALVDSLVISNKVLGTILVVSAGETNRDSTKMALQQITGHGGKVLGVVMQKVPQDRVGYGLNTYWTSSYHTPSILSRTSEQKLLAKE